MDKEILLISDKESFMTNAIKDNLGSAGFEVRFCPPQVNELNKAAKMPIVLLYLGDYVEKAGEGLIYLKDKVVEDEARLFIVGSNEEIKEVGAYIPDGVITRTFERPLNVKNLVEAMNETSELIKAEGEKKHILVVDDDPVMLRTIKGWLEGTYQVTMVNSGMNAITYLAKNKPDLILLDYEMPVITGAKVLEMIRSEVATASLPVIFLTSKGDKESVMEVLKLKPEGYLLKTMTPGEILKALEDFFVKRKNITT
ncbi:MAG: response regulator [Lachnospiraceae bacterium]|nr:response regulator [Lachnospiraceae bacterium]